MYADGGSLAHFPIRQNYLVIASAAKQPRGCITRPLGCFVASPLAMTIQLDRTPLEHLIILGRSSYPRLENAPEPADQLPTEIVPADRLLTHQE